jgi:hypothetical protein
MSLIRYIRRNDAAKFAIKAYARAETGGTLELVVTDEGPMGRVRGSITSPPGNVMPWMSLRKGALRSLENHALQSGILEMPEIEPDGPLMLNGQEFMVMDGVHYTIEIYLLGRQRTVRRFNWAEPPFSRLFNAIINYGVCDITIHKIAKRFLCTPQLWDLPIGANKSFQRTPTGAAE